MPEIEEGPGTSGKKPDVKAAEMEVNLGFVGTEVSSRAIYDGVGPSEDNMANHIGKVRVSVASYSAGSGYAAYPSENVSGTYKAYKEGDKVLWRAEDRSVLLKTNKAVVFGYAPLEGTDTDVLSADPAITASDVTIGGLTIRAEQTFDATDAKRNLCNQTDYLFATNSAERDTPVQDTVSETQLETTLYMHHAMAKISFRVMKGKGQAVDTDNDFVKQVKLTTAENIFPQGLTCTMSLVNGALTGVTPSNALSFTAREGKRMLLSPYSEDRTSASRQAYGLVAPLKKEGNIVAMEVTVGTNDSDTEKDRIYKTVADTEKLPVDWERGKEYIYAMTVTDRGLDVKLVQIVAFEPGGDADVPVD